MATSSLEIARSLYDAGYEPLKVAPRGKNPVEDKWSTIAITADDLPTRFQDNGKRWNVGARWGKGKRFDVDLDCEEARALAPYFLPPTPARIGRASSRHAHWIYASSTQAAPKTNRMLTDPDAPPPKKGDHAARILDLLGPGAQTVMPGSIHESGEDIVWDSRGEPAAVDPAVVGRAIHKIAAATLIVRRWKTGQRTDLALPIAGTLLRAGWPEKDVTHFLRAINAVAPEGDDDERTQKRLRDVVTGTAAKLAQGEEVSGLPTLVDLIGEKRVTDRFAKWLGLGAGPDPGDADGEGEPWDAPIPLDAIDLAPFPVEALPSWLGAYVRAVATYTATPEDLAGMLALTIVALSIARKLRVKPRPGSYTEPANLFTATAMEPGSRKTAVFEEMMGPVYAWEDEQRAAQEIAIVRQMALYEIASKELDNAKKAAATASAEDRLERRAAVEHLAEELARMTIPTGLRLTADDATPQRINGLLVEQQGRLALMSAEGETFDIMAGRYSSTPNLDPYLKGHAGDRIQVDRQGRPAEGIDKPALSIGLAVQPTVLRGLAKNEGFIGRGLLGRFLYALPKDNRGQRSQNPPPIPEDVRQAYTTGIRALLDDPLPKGANIGWTVTMSPEASALDLAFAEDIEARCAPGGALRTMADWASKLAGAMRRIALGLHRVQCSSQDAAIATPVSAATVRAAITIARYCIAHAMTTYSLMHSGDALGDAVLVLEWLQRTPRRDQVSARDVYRALHRHFKDAGAVRPALALLADRTYVRPMTPPPAGPQGGRTPSPTFQINPLLYGSGDTTRGSVTGSAPLCAGSGLDFERELGSVTIVTAPEPVTGSKEDSDAAAPEEPPTPEEFEAQLRDAYTQARASGCAHTGPPYVRYEHPPGSGTFLCSGCHPPARPTLSRR